MQVQREQVDKAVSALIKHQKHINSTAVKELLPSKKWIHLQLCVKKISCGQRPHPRQIQLPHSIYQSPDQADGEEGVGHLCLIVKDPQTHYKQLLLDVKNADGQSVVSKVISVGKLKRKYGTYEQKRQLADSYQVFVADERVVQMLPSLLGKKFCQKRKLPMPINLKRVILNAQAGTVERMQQAYDELYKYAHLVVPYYAPGSKESTGTMSSVKIGHCGMDSYELAENAMAAVEQVVKHTPAGWQNVHQLLLKTVKSVPLPLYKAPVDAISDDRELTATIERENAKRKRSALDSDIEEAAEEATEHMAKKQQVVKQNRKALKHLLQRIKVQDV